MNRNGEDGSVPQRHPRFFRINNEWFFRTREGGPIGPFLDIDEAEQGLNDFLEFLALADPKVRSRFTQTLVSH